MLTGVFEFENHVRTTSAMGSEKAAEGKERIAGIPMIFNLFHMSCIYIGNYFNFQRNCYKYAGKGALFTANDTKAGTVLSKYACVC
jgi:hypothetical protein